jgi:hypothetical protein
MTKPNDIEALAEQLEKDPQLQPFIKQMQAEFDKLSPAEAKEMVERMEEFSNALVQEYEDNFNP